MKEVAHLLFGFCCYKSVQRFRVTCLFTGQFTDCTFLCSNCFRVHSRKNCKESKVMWIHYVKRFMSNNESLREDWSVPRLVWQMVEHNKFHMFSGSYTLVGPPSQDRCKPPSCTTPREPTIHASCLNSCLASSLNYSSSNLSTLWLTLTRLETGSCRTQLVNDTWVLTLTCLMFGKNADGIICPSLVEGGRRRCWRQISNRHHRAGLYEKIINCEGVNFIKSFTLTLYHRREHT